MSHLGSVKNHYPDQRTFEELLANTVAVGKVLVKNIMMIITIITPKNITKLGPVWICVVSVLVMQTKQR